MSKLFTGVSRVIYSENYHLNERKYCPSYSIKLCAYVRTPEIYVFISMCKCRGEEENSGLTEIIGKKTIEGKDAEIKEMNNG